MTIFFVVTTNLQSRGIKDKWMLAMAVREAPVKEMTSTGVINCAEGNVWHEHVKMVMEACTKASSSQVKREALREQG